MTRRDIIKGASLAVAGGAPLSLEALAKTAGPDREIFALVREYQAGQIAFDAITGKTDEQTDAWCDEVDEISARLVQLVPQTAGGLWTLLLFCVSDRSLETALGHRFEDNLLQAAKSLSEGEGSA